MIAANSTEVQRQRLLERLKQSLLDTLAQVLVVSAVTNWRWSKDGRLPKPRKLGANTTRWNVGQFRAALATLAA